MGMRLLAWWLGAMALIWAASIGPIQVIEVAVLLVVVAGVSVSLRRPRSTRGPVVRHGRALPDPEVAAATIAALESLDGIEHRRVELGAPWPAVVVGPTGVHLVDVCPFADGGRCGAPDRLPMDGCARCDRNAAISALIGRQLAGLTGTRQVPIRTLAVVAAGARVPPAADDGDGQVAVIVPVDRLPDALARGPVLPMADVERAYRSLTVLTTARSTPSVVSQRA
jgi:hypothetical protein